MLLSLAGPGTQWPLGQAPACHEEVEEANQDATLDVGTLT